MRGNIARMRLSISKKLVLAFVGLTVLVLVATLALARWSFERGFLEYVNAVELERLQRASSNVAQEYVAADRSWSTLTAGRFIDVLQSSGPTEPFAGPAPDADRRPADRRAEGRPPRGTAGPPPRRRGRRGPPTAVLDLDGQYIAGQEFATQSDENIRVPILVDGVAVGTLISKPRRQFTSPQETAFATQQLSASWLIGIASVALSLVISIILARGLLAPIRRMVRSVGQLSNGDYSVRLGEKRTDELGQLMGDLDRLGTKLEHSQSSRRRWLADISHELRTPITVLAGELQALKDGLRRFDERQVDSLAQEVQRLHFLIDDLYELSVSDVGGLRYEFSDVDINELASSAVDSIRERAADQGIEVISKLENGMRIDADANRIGQLLHNVFENSLAYTDAPGRMEVTLSQAQEHARIEIHDTPPGVSESDCERLFDPLFRREASRSRRTGGAGLGLAICQKIVEAHGGTIVAMPSPLGGLCIRIDIPCRALERA